MGKYHTVYCSLCNGKYTSIVPGDCNTGDGCQFVYHGINITTGKHEFSGGYWSNYDSDEYEGTSNFGLKKGDCICNDCTKQKIDKKELVYVRNSITE